MRSGTSEFPIISGSSSGSLASIDGLIRAVGNEKRNQIQSDHLFRRLCEEILRHESVPAAQRLANPIKTCFDAAIPLATKRFAAAAFLRVLPSNPSVFQETSLNTSFHKLLDGVLQELYGSLKIDRHTSRFDKEQQLADAVVSIESQLRGTIASFKALSEFSVVRQDFKRGLNSGIARAVVWPFTGREFVTVKLDALCAATAEYQTAKGEKKFPLLEQARLAASAYAAESESLQSDYSRLLGSFALQVLTHLNEDFSASPLSKPATLRIALSPKKYPLTSLGSNIHILVTLENLGPGRASDIQIDFETTENLSPREPRRFVGDMEPNTTIRDVVLECDLIAVENIGVVSGALTWHNFGKVQQTERFEFELVGQRVDISWANLETEDPYSTEAIANADDLVGRTDQMTQLLATLSAKNAGSFYVLGQKRVGKTSLVKAVAARLQEKNGRDYFALYLDAGDFVDPDPDTTISQLGKRLCQGIKEADPRFKKLTIPKFDRALAPLDEFLRGVAKAVPTFRVVFILDEFDQLPVQIYRRGAIGDSFFLTLRSISSKPPFAFVLVGGEKMEFIVSAQGDQLNKFQRMRVDYFDKERHWADFEDLIRRPVRGWFEVSDEAVSQFYTETEGNPYFTKLIAREMFRTLVRRRDSHVTPREVREASRIALLNTGENVFQHFWEDGILEETGDREEERSMFRRRVLLALADALQIGGGNDADRAVLLDQARRDGLDTVEVDKEIQDFERRQVLITKNNRIRTRVHLFGEWLRDHGVHEIVTTFTDKDMILKRKEEDSRLRIKEEEVLDACARWPTYKGRTVGPEAVRHWLTQFGYARDQRLMFALLTELRFYGSDYIREKLKLAHVEVARLLARRGVAKAIPAGKRSRRDILVSYLGGPGKSGIRYAQLYAEVNGILSDNIVERERITTTLEQKPEVEGVVFADDFIGTGESAEDYITAVATESGAILRARQISLVYAVIAGFGPGIERLDAVAKDLSLNLTISVGDPLSSADTAFSQSSRIYPDTVERERAREIALAQGRHLVKDAPLGFGDLAADVVFEFNCPNNSLPILWAESTSWTPLFKRL